MIAPTEWDLRECRASGALGRYQLGLKLPGDISIIHYFAKIIYDLGGWADKMSGRLVKEKYDAIIGIADFSESLVASAFGEKLRLGVPSTKAVVGLHKRYLSRVLQQRIVPDSTPPFALVDMEHIYPRNPPLPYPFF